MGRQRVLAWVAGAVSGVLASALAMPAVAVADASPARLGGVRFATFNASLNRDTEGQLLKDLSTPDDPQARKVAEVLQRVRPDVVLLNEFDFVEGGRAVDAFRRNYLEIGQGGAQPVHYPHVWTAPVNTGVPSGFDLNKDGRVGGGDDAWGFGLFPGQYGMVVLSRHPIDAAAARTFQNFRWRDMPGALLPDDASTPRPNDWYSDEVLARFPLSSKSHWDLPVRVGGRSVHFLVSHPTPPTFDGPEDRNGRRNHDEIRFWADYVRPGRADYVYDDAGRRGGLPVGAPFVVAGDQNADPLDGDSVDGAINQLRHAPRVIDLFPVSTGAAEAAVLQGGANARHRGPSFLDTGDFDDRSVGNLRVDWVLPSRPLLPLRSGVFWPPREDPLSRLNDASDHHLVWVDLLVPGGR